MQVAKTIKMQNIGMGIPAMQIEEQIHCSISLTYILFFDK